MDHRTAFTLKAYANSSPPFSTAEWQHEFADCVHALEDYSAYCVSGIQIMQDLSAGICHASGEYSLG
jgi:hypothetical protein